MKDGVISKFRIKIFSGDTKNRTNMKGENLFYKEMPSPIHKSD